MQVVAVSCEWRFVNLPTVIRAVCLSGSMPYIPSMPHAAHTRGKSTRALAIALRWVHTNNTCVFRAIPERFAITFEAAEIS